MSNKLEFKLLKLEKSNYVVWKWQFKNVLKARNLSDVLDTTKIVRDATKDCEAMALLGSALNDENILKIINCDTFVDAWKAIETCHENKTSYEPQSLYRRLNSYKITSASEVSAGVSEIRGIVAQLKNLNESVSNNCLIGAILSALPSSFDVFITVWKNSADKDVDALISKLMAEASEQTIRDNNEAKALMVNNQRSKDKNTKQNKKDRCRYCKETGHWIKNCPNLKTPYDPNHGAKMKESRKNKSNPIKDGDELAFVTIGTACTVTEDLWVADSGCTHHMSPHKELFNHFSLTGYQGMVQLANSKSVKVMGIGEIMTAYGKLQNVYYVPELSHNLFSISTASSCGLTHLGSKDKIQFYHGDKELFTAHLENKIYILDLKVKKPIKIKGLANAATIEDWHHRFGHVSMDTLKKMITRKAVDGLEVKGQATQVCENCTLNKCTRVHHPPRTTEKSKVAGTVLHIDTAGPSPVESRGKSKYLMLCKDEFSKYRQVAFMKTKDQIPDQVKLLISQSILETGNQVLKIVTDNGSEYVNKNLESYYRQRGIIHQRSAPYTANQNGLIERDIRTIKESARTLLNDSKLDKDLWPEAVFCAVYALNRVLNSSSETTTPYELWHGKRPNVKNLRRFGEIAILKKPDQIISGWNEKGERAIFICYTDRFNTYKFLKEDGKMVITCDAVFINKMYNGEKPLPPTQVEPEEFWLMFDNAQEAGGGNDSPQSPKTITTQPNSGQGTSQNDPNISDLISSGESSEDENEVYMSPDETQQVQNSEPQPGSSNLNSDNQTSSQPTPMSTPNTSEFTTLAPHIKVKYSPGILGAGEGYKFIINPGTDQEQRIKYKDMIYDERTRCYRDKKTAKFIKNDIANILNQYVQSRTDQANIGRAMLAVNKIKLPTSYEEVLESTYKDHWLQAINDEIKSLKSNKVFIKVPINNINKRPVSSKWVFTVKQDEKGNVEKFKARIVARGFSQRYGLDYTETYCSVVQIMTTRLLLNYAAQRRLNIKQFDIKTAFLYGNLNEQIYMIPPDGLQEENTVWELKRSLYGLKQSPRMWNIKFSTVLKNIGLEPSTYDNSVFYSKNQTLFVLVYVDDGLILGEKETETIEVLTKLKEHFEMRNLKSNTTMYRGLQIETHEHGIFVHQTRYTNQIIETYNMKQSNPTNNPIVVYAKESEQLKEATPYRNAVGSLAYLADTSRPDIAYAVNRLARKMSQPNDNDWKAVKQVLKYLQGTKTHGIWYKTMPSSNELIGFCDSDFAGDESSKSTTGYLITFNGSIFHWKSQLQRHVTLSSTEAEVIALCSLAKEMSWIRRMMIELGIMKDEPSIIMCDNISCIKIVQSEKYTARTRHLRARYAFIRELITDNELQLKHVSSANQKADLLTKIVATHQFTANRNNLLTTVKEL